MLVKSRCSGIAHRSPGCLTTCGARRGIASLAGSPRFVQHGQYAEMSIINTSRCKLKHQLRRRPLLGQCLLVRGVGMMSLSLLATQCCRQWVMCLSHPSQRSLTLQHREEVLRQVTALHVCQRSSASRRPAHRCPRRHRRRCVHRLGQTGQPGAKKGCVRTNSTTNTRPRRIMARTLPTRLGCIRTRSALK